MCHSSIRKYLRCSMKAESKIKMFFVSEVFRATYAIVIPAFSENDRDDIPSILSDMFGISNQKNKYTRFVKYMQQLVFVSARSNTVLIAEFRI